MTDVSNREDILDSRDVIERIQELAYEIMDAEAGEDVDDLQDELGGLSALQGEAEGYSGDWRHGATLIRDSYFVDYAQELAYDIGAVSTAASWPNDCIDWERAARELQADYTAVDFDGITYWVR